MNPIDTAFADLKAAGRKAFIPFLTAGDPDLATSMRLIRAAADGGAAVVEVGFPFSDPIADGPVIQASYTRALAKHIKVDDIFASLGELTATPGWETPLVAMLSYSLIYRRGPEAFIGRAKAAGLSGAIVPDLPMEEAASLAALAAGRDFKLILLVTPTTSPERARRIAELTTGFLYCVSVAGVTGERAELPPEVADYLARLRGLTGKPLCLGFGVSRPEQAVALQKHVDGVIVGSAVVRRVEQAPPDEVEKEIGGFTEAFVRALSG